MEIFEDNGFVENESSLVFSAFNNDPHILDNIHVRVTLIVLYTVTFVFCVFGNLAVLLVVTLHWRMRSITKICLGNMAVANLSVGIFCVYQNLSTYLFDSWLFGDWMCKMYHFVTSVCHTASILILVVLSVERYLVLLHSFKSIRMLTKRNLVLTVVGVWTSAAIISLPRLFYFGLLRISLSDTESAEICVPRKSKYNSATADTIYFVLLYVIPLGILTVLYARIAWYLQRSGDMLKPRQLSASRTSSSSSELSSVKSDGAAAAQLIPGATMETISPVKGEKSSTSGSLEDFEISVVVTTVIYGVIYAVSSEKFRDTPMKRPSQTGPTHRIHLAHIRRQERHSSVVRMLIVIVMTFALLSLPFHIRKLCVHYLPSFDMSSDLNTIIAPLTYLLTYSNCAINPILYAFLSRHFRQSFVDLTRCKRGRSSMSGSPNFV